MRFLLLSALFCAIAAPALADKPIRLTKDVRESEQHTLKGLTFLEMGEYEAAIREFTDASSLDPQPKNTLHIAECQEAMGNLVAAIASYRHYFAESNDPSPPLRKHLAELEAKFHDANARKLHGDHDYHAALKEFQEAQKSRLDPKRWYDIALCYEELSENGKAIEHYRRYLDEAKNANDAGEVEGRIKILSGERMAQPPPPPAPAPPPIHPAWFTSGGGWLLTASTLVLAGGSGALFGLTGVAGDDALHAHTEDQFIAAQSSGSLYNTLGITLSIAAGVALIAAIVVFAAHTRPESSRPTPISAPSTATTGIW